MARVKEVDLSAAQLVFKAADGNAGLYEVVRFRCQEGLNQLYRVEIELLTEQDAVAFDSVVGKPGTLSVNTPRGERHFHGIVSRFELVNQANHRLHLRAELCPKVWVLSQRYGSRIFQNKSIKEIIEDIFKKAGITSDHYKFSLSNPSGPREYCVQYRETDLNFICRLMEEEGIWFCFDQTVDSHVMFIADGPGAVRPIDGDAPQIPFVDPSALITASEAVFRFRLGQGVRPGSVRLNDFNFETPKTKLDAKSDAGRDKDFEFSDYPGEYTDAGQGKSLAKVRIEAFEAGRRSGIGESNSYRLAPGRKFTLAEHPVDGVNSEYLLTRVIHQGKQATTTSSTGQNGRLGRLDPVVASQLMNLRHNGDAKMWQLADTLQHLASRIQRGDSTARREVTDWLHHGGQVTSDLSLLALVNGASPSEALTVRNLLEDILASSETDEDAAVYACRFECIPADVTYRPPRVSPWPEMSGCQTARVVGPKGEEIHTDKYGRVKVQFNWDREGKFDENASCWIRVSQGLAGGSYGMMFLPRVGQEVVVDFLEGDPDRPIIVGRLYNGDHMPPYKLPDEKTKSVIKTNSSKGGGGSNEVRFEDLKGKEQLLVHAEKDLHTRVKEISIESIGKDRHLTVDGKQIELVKKEKQLQVELDLSEKIGGKKSLKVVGDVAEDFGANHSEKVGMAHYLKAGMNVVIEAGMSITLKVGGNFVNIGPTGVTIVGTMVLINSGGAAGSGSAVALKNPEKPKEADKIKPGKDTTYSGGETLAAGATPKDVAGHVFEEPKKPEEKKPAWIELELVDDEGKPVPNEAYRVKDAKGKKFEGNLDENGFIHIDGVERGDTEICFPEIDKDGWRRA